jgi:pyruvate dehydrogenase E2 component (dihydrolipoamide acetyltransferase)
MPVEVILPVLGETMDEGTIVAWLAEVGQSVVKGEPLYQVETDKAVLDVEAPESGVLRDVFYAAGAKVPVLAVVGLIAAPGEEIADYVPSKPPQASAALPQGPVVTSQASEAPAPKRVFSSPRARKAAATHGVELVRVQGSGPGGRIVEADVLSFVAARPSATPVARKAAGRAGLDLVGIAGTGRGGRVSLSDVQAALSPAAAPLEEPAVAAERRREPLTGVRKIIAERMSASAHTTAPVTLTTEADASELVQFRSALTEQFESALGFAPSYSGILVLIVARGLREYSYMNARLVDDVIEQVSQVNIGVAVDTPNGLLVPVIRDADTMRVADIARTMRELATRARAGRSMPDDLRGGTFTITNLGMYDVDAFTPIINPPECAILGAGRIQERPVVCKGHVCVRPMMVLSLTFDHRLVDGAPAARFLQRIKQLVEQPCLLLA